MLRVGSCHIKFLDKGLDGEEGRDSSGGEGASIERNLVSQNKALCLVSPCFVSTISFTLIVMHSSCRGQVRLMIILKLLILFSKFGIFFSEVFHLLDVLLFECVHLLLQGGRSKYERQAQELVN